MSLPPARPCARPAGQATTPVLRLARAGAAASVIFFGALLTAPAPSAAGSAHPPAPQLSLPPLTGSWPVGTVPVRLVDRSRQDPTFGSRHRELMVQFWYPAASITGFPRAAYMPPRTAAYAEHQARLPPGTISRIVVRAYQRPPVATGRHPVLLYSPGSGDMRSASTTLLENLASEGFVVVAIDHTHEADAVEFPGGQLVKGTFVDTGPASNTEELAIRVADTRFVLSQLQRLARRVLFRGHLDLAAIGMFGHSLGGATAAATMLADPRIRAGADLDGSLYGPVATTGLGRPFLLMTTSLPRPDFPADPSMRPFYHHLRGPRAGLQLAGAAHQVFTDVAQFKAQLPPAIAARIGNVGTINPVLAEQTVTRYLAAFFDRYLRGRPEPLLTGTGGPTLKVIGSTRRHNARATAHAPGLGPISPIEVSAAVLLLAALIMLAAAAWPIPSQRGNKTLSGS